MDKKFRIIAAFSMIIVLLSGVAVNSEVGSAVSSDANLTGTSDTGNSDREINTIKANQVTYLYLNEDNCYGTPGFVDLSDIRVQGEPDYENVSGIEYVSENEDVAIVTAGHIVVAKHVGTVNITAEAVTEDGQQYHIIYPISVKENAAGITIQNIPEGNKMAVGQTVDFNRELRAAVSKTSTDKTMWRLSDNTAGAKVDSKGRVTAEKPGEFTLTAIAYQSKKALKKFGEKAYSASSEPVTIQVLPDDRIENEDSSGEALTISNREVGNLIIDDAVKTIHLKLENMNVVGTLYLPEGLSGEIQLANTAVSTIKSYAGLTTFALDGEDAASGVPEGKSGTSGLKMLVAEGSRTEKIYASDKMSIEQDGNSVISEIGIEAGNHHMAVSIKGFNGNLVVGKNDSDVKIAIESCNIMSALITESSGTIDLNDVGADGGPESLIRSLQISGQAGVQLGVKTEVLEIQQEAGKSELTILRPVGELNSRADQVKTIVKSKIDKLSVSGRQTGIELFEGAQVSEGIFGGEGAVISGQGSVMNAVVSGDGIKMDVAVEALKVEEGVKNAIVNGSEAKPGQQFNATPQKEPSGSGTQIPPSFPPSSDHSTPPAPTEPPVKPTPVLPKLVDGLFTYTLRFDADDNGEISLDGIAEGITVPEALVIPNTFEGYPVTRVSSNIVDGLTYEQKMAVKRIEVPANVKDLMNGRWFFSGIEEIVISEDNAVWSSQEGVLFNKDKTELIYYPSKRPGRSYTVPDTVKVIKRSSFWDAQAEEIIIPNTVEEIEENAFRSNNHDLEVRIDDSHPVYKVQDGMLIVKATMTLQECIDSRREEYVIPDGVHYIGKDAFHDIRARSFLFPEGLIGFHTGGIFAGCDSIENIYIPDSVTENPDNLFTTFAAEGGGREYPVNLYGKVGSAAEEYANGHKHAFIAVTQKPVSFPISAQLYLTEEESQKVTISGLRNLGKELDEYILPYQINGREVVKVGASAFENACATGAAIRLSGSITEIESRAFANAKVGSIKIPNSVSVIAEDAFSGCILLKDFYLEADNPYYRWENGTLTDIRANKAIFTINP